MNTEGWWFAQLRPASHVHVFELGHRAALFDESRQALQELNQTALEIWRLVAANQTCAEVAAALEAAGVAPADANVFASAALLDWLRSGLVVPVEVEALRSNGPEHALRIVADGRAYVLRMFGEAQARDLLTILSHFASDVVQSPSIIDVVGRWGRNFVFYNGQAQGMSEPHQTPPRVKALIGGDPAIGSQVGFLVHGALLSANGKRLFLAGEPGAGKTTLSLALASSGFAYGGDDVTRVYPDGSACGVPFAAAAKRGAWPLLKRYVPELESIPVLERGDDVLVRYVLPPNLDTLGPRPIDITIALQRGEEAGAQLEPVNPLDSLVAFLDSAWAGGRQSTDAQTLLALASEFSRMRHYRLIYSDLEGAVAALQDLVTR
jgi:hypothetical protein